MYAAIDHDTHGAIDLCHNNNNNKNDNNNINNREKKQTHQSRRRWHREAPPPDPKTCGTGSEASAARKKSRVTQNKSGTQASTAQHTGKGRKTGRTSPGLVLSHESPVAIKKKTQTHNEKVRTRHTLAVTAGKKLRQKQLGRVVH